MKLRPFVGAQALIWTWCQVQGLAPAVVLGHRCPSMGTSLDMQVLISARCIHGHAWALVWTCRFSSVPAVFTGMHGH